ncbi:MAG: hypothetical protein E7616_06805 [Ruminococcaceae bacterium]|nr:hypothetical protein [Oscillospiraceae bacterium]
MKNILFWIILLFSLSLLTMEYILNIRKTYVCPICGTKFRPKWHEVSTWYTMETCGQSMPQLS